MIILLSSITLTVLGLVILKVTKDYASYRYLLGIMLFITGVSVIFLSLITIPISRADTEVFMEQYKTTEMTYKNARNSAKYLESATLQLDILKINRKLVKLQYYNDTIFGLWYPDSINSLTPLK